MSLMPTSEAAKHLVLAIEVPCFYTEDMEDLSEIRSYYGDEPPGDSDLILNHIGEPSVVRLVTEISGEKEGDVIDVLGCVRGASLETPSPGVTDEWLQEGSWKLGPEQDELIEHAVAKLRRANVPLPEIVELLEGEIAELKRRIDKEG